MKMPKNTFCPCQIGGDHSEDMDFVGVQFNQWKMKDIFFVCNNHVLSYLGSNHFMVVHKTLWAEMARMPILNDFPEDLPYKNIAAGL